MIGKFLFEKDVLWNKHNGLNLSNIINLCKDLHLNLKGSGKLHQNIINFITKDFPI